MAEFNIRTDAVDVEQIMRQIRARIREKRGVDYTEEQIQELASVKLEKFLDAKGMRSDLVDQFRRSRGASPQPRNYAFEDTMLFDSHRASVRWIRTLLKPILKLFVNPIIHVLHELNDHYAQRFDARDELDALYYEVIHNLVLEITRLGIEVKNLKMRIESMSSRLDFDERRARALEGVVQYRPGTVVSRDHDQAAVASAGPASAASSSATAAGQEGQSGLAARRRRRRRRGRRGRSGTPPAGSSAMVAPGPSGTPGESAAAASREIEPSSEPGDDGADGGPSPSDL